MKGLAIGYKGLENELEADITELVKAKTEKKEGFVLFDADFDDFCRLCYCSQAALKIIHVLFSCKLEEVKQNIAKNKEIGKWVDGKTFCMRVEGIDKKHEADFGSAVNGNVNLTNPDVPFCAYSIDGINVYFGVDFAGFDLSKREYKIFNLPNSLKGPVGFCLLKFADYKAKQIFLDPFCGSGVIPIEAALHASSFPVNYYHKSDFAFLKFNCFNKFDFNKFFEKIDKKIDMGKKTINAYDSQVNAVKSTEKNAKVAGINKKINFGRQDVEWLDIKFKKNELDLIATEVPFVSKVHALKDIMKIYREFFYQSDFILKNKGKIAVIAKDDLIEQAALENKFIVKSKKKIHANLDFIFYLFEKKK